MKRSRLLGLIACFAAAGFAVVLARSGLPRIQGPIAVEGADARAAEAPGVPSPIRSTDEAVAALTSLEARSHVGLTQSDIASTSPVYRFGTRTGAFTAGLSVYRTPFESGFCLTFASATSCTRVLPSAPEPLIGLALDVDAERAGEPFVVISVKAPNVRSVTYTCAGTTYPATISGDVVAFVSPKSTLRADDCTESVTLAGGRILSKRV